MSLSVKGERVMSNFTFTSNIYTGETGVVLAPIRELILGISCTLEFPQEYGNIIYAGNRDEVEEVPMFWIDTDFITRLRHSPEYHDAVFDYLIDKMVRYKDGEIQESFYRDPKNRDPKNWTKLMRDYGVLGKVSLFKQGDQDAE